MKFLPEYFGKFYTLKKFCYFGFRIFVDFQNSKSKNIYRRLPPDDDMMTPVDLSIIWMNISLLCYHKKYLKNL